MKITVRTKVLGSLAIIVAIGMFAKILMYGGLRAVESSVHRLAEVEEPLNAAAYEMEINSNGLGLGVLKYLNTRNPDYRKWVNRDIADFEKFHATYSRLARSDEERNLASEVGARFGEYTGLGRTMLGLADEQEGLFEQAAAHIERIDELIHGHLQRGLQGENLSGPRLRTASALAHLEAEIAEVGFWTANYRRLQNPEFKVKIDEKLRQFQQGLADLQGSKQVTDEERDLLAIRESFGQAKKEIAEVVVLEDRMLENRERFLRIRDSIDALLDQNIQVLALQGLDVPRADAEAQASKALHTLGLMMAIYIGGALLVGLLLTGSILRPLALLKRGAEIVGAGDLDYRIPTLGADEFGDVAGEFNRMVEDLKQTTVSKARLQQSEAKLSQTVADLRREIGERERAQAEQGRLQAALRRSETMSAMGALVAGVAHEVRNPLFGISSTLDAMDARFVDRREHQRYSAALRAEVERMSKLMADLLQYGKPTVSEMVPGSVNGVIAQAVRLCTPIAESAQIRLVQHIQADLPVVLMDRARLPQVFRNILENAIQHSPPREQVSISTELDGEGRVVCSVEDGGPGFHPEDIDHVFDPFFTRRRGGTGLGLSIVARIVEEHHGTVQGCNGPKGGAIVTVSLPAAHGALERSA